MPSVPLHIFAIGRSYLKSPDVIEYFCNTREGGNHHPIRSISGSRCEREKESVTSTEYCDGPAAAAAAAGRRHRRLASAHPTPRHRQPLVQGFQFQFKETLSFIRVGGRTNQTTSGQTASSCGHVGAGTPCHEAVEICLSFLRQIQSRSVVRDR